MGTLNVLIINSARRWIGEAARCLHLAKLLASSGHGVVLVVRKDRPLHLRALDEGIPVHTLHMTGKFTGVLDIADVLTLRRLIRKYDIRIVHAHRGKDHWISAAALRLISSSKRPALIRTRHVVMPVKQHPGNRWLYRKATDAIVAVSKAARDSFGSLLDTSRNSSPHVVYAGVNSTEFSPQHYDRNLRESLGAKENDVLVGLIGRFQRIKGQEVFLKAASLLAREHPNWHYLVCGRETKFDRSRYTTLSASLGISQQVLVLPEQKDIASLIASLDIGVIASLGSEGSSRIAFEYMASGVPIIATRVGCLPEILIHEENGLLVIPDDPGALAEALERLITSTELRKRFSRRGRELALSRYSPHTFLSHTLEVYRTRIYLNLENQYTQK